MPGPPKGAPLSPGVLAKLRLAEPWHCPGNPEKGIPRRHFRTTWLPAKAKHEQTCGKPKPPPEELRTPSSLKMNSLPPAAPRAHEAPPASPSPRRQVREEIEEARVEGEMEVAWASRKKAVPASASQPQPRKGGRTLSEERVVEIVRDEARAAADAIVTARTRRLGQPFGILPIEGRLELRRHGTQVTAVLDGSDLGQLLAATYRDGARLRLLVLDLAALEGDEPQLPKRGQSGLVYTGYDANREKRTSLLDQIREADAP